MGLLYLSKEQKGEVFFFMGQTQYKSVDVIEAWAAEVVPVVFLLWGGSRSNVGVMDSLIILSPAAPATPSGDSKGSVTPPLAAPPSITSSRTNDGTLVSLSTHATQAYGLIQTHICDQRQADHTYLGG